MRRFGLMLALFLLLSFAGDVAPAAAQTPEEGLKVYTAQRCSLCHMVGGRGNKNGPLDDVGAKLTAEEIRQWIVAPIEMSAKAGATRKPPMKPYMLSEADLDALVAYLLTLKGTK